MHTLLVVILSVLSEQFADCPLGRLLQSFEMYILIRQSHLLQSKCGLETEKRIILEYVLYVAFDDVDPPGEADDEPAVDEEKRSAMSRRISAAESFSAVQISSDDAVRSPNLSLPSPSRLAARRPSIPRRPSSFERLASRVSRRLSGRPVTAADLTFGYRSSTIRDGGQRGRSDSTTTMMRKEDVAETIGSESIYSMYTSDDVQRLTGIVNTPVRAPRRGEAFSVPQTAPPVPRLTLGVSSCTLLPQA